MAATLEQILRDLKNKIYKPVYFLHGDEPYYTDIISSYIEDHVLEDMEKEFNQVITYGRDVNKASIISTAKSYPMIGSHQVVIVKEAQEMRDLIPADGNKDTDPLLIYLKNPQPSTILVFCYKYKKLDKRRALYKALNASSAVVFEGKKLYDNQVAPWVSNYLRDRKYSANPRVCAIIADHLGNDLSRIANELNKLMINVPQKEEITETHVEDFIGISKEYNVFELQNAIGTLNAFKANRIAAYMAANAKEYPIMRILPSLMRFFTNILIYYSLSDKSRNNLASKLGISPHFVGEYETAARNFPLARVYKVISLFRQFDLKAKGLGANPSNIKEGDLVRELIFLILN